MNARGLWKAAAWLFTALAGAAGCVIPFLRWQPQESFDILGVLWVLTNMPKLAAWAFLIMLGALALYCWARTAMADR